MSNARSFLADRVQRDHAIACAERRRAAHVDEPAVSVHGDVQQWNTLRAGEA